MKTIAQIVVAVTIGFLVIFALCNIFGVFPGRYQYIPTQEQELAIPFASPDGKAETEYRYVTNKLQGIFDTWTGTEYRWDEITNMVYSSNFRNGRAKLIGSCPSVDMPKQGSAEQKEMKNRIMRKLNREDEKKKEELLKAILPKAMP